MLRFYEEVPGQPDKLVFKAAAVDVNADGVSDLQFGGDVNRDGKDNAKDEKLIRAFANSFLKLGWFNRGRAGSVISKCLPRTITATRHPIS
ncbi:hypothetical protein QNM99_10230 [Pseudomonas sp. PCH446]